MKAKKQALKKVEWVLAGLILAALPAAVSGQVVISQVYGGGGSGSAPWRNDFVELCNRGTTPVALGGWSLQYTTATGTSWGSQKVALPSVTLQPGQYFLVQLASGGSTGNVLPTADAAGTFNMNATAGKVALVSSTTSLPSVTCPSDPGIVDFVGYGTSANCREGSANAPAPSNTTSIFRLHNGCVDTGQNGADFLTGTPRPRNSAAPRNLCTLGLSETVTDLGGPGGAIDGTLSVNEYGTGNVYQFGGDGAGFGGMVGYYAANVTNPRVFFKSDASSIRVGLRLGASFSGTNDTAVILLDTVTGGISGGTTVPFDNNDATQRAVGRAIQSAPTGLGIDAAIAFNSRGVFGYTVASSGLTLQSGNTAVGSGLSAAQFREIRVPYTNLPGFSSGSPINFVVLLNNGAAAPSTSESDESIPVSPAFSGAGNPGNSGGVLTNYNRFVTAFYCTAPAISAQPISQAVCPDSPVTFTVAATGSPAPTYQWRKGGINISGAMSPSLTIDPVTPASAGSYDCVATNACGSATSNPAMLTVYEQPLVSLAADGGCHGGPAPVLAVAINLSAACEPITGGQFFLHYDTTRLAFLDATPGDAAGTNPANPFEVQIYEAVNAAAGTVDFAVGIPSGGSGTQNDVTMATVRFIAVGDACNVANLVTFRANPPFTTRLSGFGHPLATHTADVGPVTIDVTPPTYTAPVDVNRPADAGGCTLTLTAAEIGGVTGIADACSPPVTTAWVRSDGQTVLNAPFQTGDTRVTWMMTDACGNTATHVQTIHVAPYNRAVLAIELQGLNQAATRCIRLLFKNCVTHQIEERFIDVPFGGGGQPSLVFIDDLPCAKAPYTCVTAEDTLHSLRVRITGAPGLQVIDDMYAVDFTGSRRLRTGDYFNDEVVDIIDFCVFLASWRANYGTGDTLCGAFPPNSHADVTGDGVVDLSDCAVILANFLAVGDGDCCIATLTGAEPRPSVDVQDLPDLGVPEGGVADLNGDGVVDSVDVELLQQGATLAPPGNADVKNDPAGNGATRGPRAPRDGGRTR